MEQAAREAKSTFLTQVDPKGKRSSKGGREKSTTHAGEKPGQTNPGSRRDKGPRATQPRTTLYHKTVEEAWRTKMLIGKMCADRKETNRTGYQRTRRRCSQNSEPPQQPGGQGKKTSGGPEEPKEKMERMAGQFHLYLRYVHHIDITPADRNGTPTCIRKIRLVEQREENEAHNRKG
jgi:hypothetical protein